MSAVPRCGFRPALTRLFPQGFQREDFVKAGFLQRAPKFESVEDTDLFSSDPQGDKWVGNVETAKVTHIGIVSRIGVEKQGLIGGCGHGERRFVSGQGPYLLRRP